MKRREGESKLEHHTRLVMGKLVDKTLADVDYVELSEEVYGRKLSSDVARRMMYGSRETLELIEAEKVNSADTDIINELTEKQRELKKERMKLQHEKAEYNKFLREQSRAELFEEKVISAIKDNIVELKVPQRNNINSNVDKSAVLLISDIHYGQELKIVGLNGEIMNEYSPEVFEQRMWDLLDRTVGILNKECIKHISVFNLGDAIQGILRSNSQLMSLRYGIVDGYMKFINFMANWLSELSRYVDVDYYNVPGNHDDIRVVTGKKGDFPHENIGRMGDWVLEAMLRDAENVVIHREVNKGMVYTQIQGFNMLAIHGDSEKKLENSIKDYSMLYGEDIDFLLTGHKHFDMTQNVLKDKEIVQCPSLIGMCEYSVKLKKSANAGAKLFIVEQGKGKTIDYNIKLN